MHPLWNHCNHGNGKCREKAARAGQCGNRGDEESRGTVASADQLWMARSPQHWHNGPCSAHSQNFNTFTQLRVETMYFILQLFWAAWKTFSNRIWPWSSSVTFQRYLRWQQTLWTWCVGGSWTLRWWRPLLSPHTLWTPRAAQERVPSNGRWENISVQLQRQKSHQWWSCYCTQAVVWLIISPDMVTMTICNLYQHTDHFYYSNRVNWNVQSCE